MSKLSANNRWFSTDTVECSAADSASRSSIGSAPNPFDTAKRSIKAKMASSDGFTMAELMAALLILGLVSMMLVVGISLGARQYQESMLSSESKALSSTLTAKLTDELRSANTFTLSGSRTEGETTHFTYESFWTSNGQMEGLVCVDSDGKERSSDLGGYLAFKNTEGSLLKLVGNPSYTRSMRAMATLDWNDAGDSDRYDVDHPVCSVELQILRNDGSTISTTTFTVIPANS